MPLRELLSGWKYTKVHLSVTNKGELQSRCFRTTDKGLRWLEDEWLDGLVIRYEHLLSEGWLRVLIKVVKK